MMRLLSVLILLVLGWSVWQSTPTSSTVAAAGGDRTVRLSVASDGTQANAGSGDASISPDGGWVVFRSSATNLVPNDTNQQADLFLHEIATGTTTRITKGWNGSEYEGYGYGNIRLSTDGRYVAFASHDSNLVPNDTNNARDCFVYDRVTDSTAWVSVTSDEEQVPTYQCDIDDMTPDGRYILFTSNGHYDPDSPNAGELDVYLRDQVDGTTTRIPPTTDRTVINRYASISDDARYVAFVSTSETLVPNDRNGVADAFILDRTTGDVIRGSVASNGIEADIQSTQAELSGDGTTLFFTTMATNLGYDKPPGFDTYAHDIATGESTWVSVRETPERPSGMDEIPPLGSSTDGRYVALSSRFLSKEQPDVWVRDRAADVSFSVNVASDGTPGNGAAIANGWEQVISSDGRRIAFVSVASNLVADDTNSASDVFVRLLESDPLPTATPTITPTPTQTRLPISLYLPMVGRERGFLTLPQITNLTTNANGRSFAPVASADGSVIAFLSEASNLVPNDTNGKVDAFVWHQQTRAFYRASVGLYAAQADADSTAIRLTEDGRYLLFLTEAGLGAADTNNRADVYRHDLQTGVTEWVSVGVEGAAGNGAVTGMDISADGQWVVFSSQARNLIITPLPETCVEGICETLYRRNMATGVTETWFVENGMAMSPISAPSLSADGQRVAYERRAVIGYVCSNTSQPIYGSHLYYYDGGGSHQRFAESIYLGCGRPTPALEPQAGSSNDDATHPHLARDSASVSYDRSLYSSSQYSTSWGNKVVLRALTGTNTQHEVLSTSFEVSITQPQPPNSRVSAGNKALSNDGRMVAFTAPDLRYPWDFGWMTRPYFVYDRNEKLDIYRYDAETEAYILITDAGDGELSNGDSKAPFIVGDGSRIVFESDATNLTRGDTNGVTDIFIWHGVR